MSEIDEIKPRNDLVPSTPGYRLSDRARELVGRAMPDSTKRAYLDDLHRFLTHCAEWGIAPPPPKKGDPPAVFLAFADLLAAGADIPLLTTEHVARLADDDKAPSTVERAIAAVSRTYKAITGDKMNNDVPRAALKAYRRDRASTPGSAPRRATPVTVDVLRALVDTTDPATLTGRRDRALLVLGFALGARRSELAALDVADLRETAEGLEVLIRTSKTDKDSTGRTVGVPYGAHLGTCPVRVTRAWLAALGRTTGPLFLRIDRNGTLGRAPAGGAADGRLTGQAIALVVKRAADRAGLDPAAAWSGHSLRRGFATEAYRKGADRLRIARHGGWDDNSRALSGYVEDVDRWKDNPLIGIGL